MRKSLSFLSILYIALLIFQLLPFFQSIRNAFSESAAFQNSFFVMLIGLFLVVIFQRGVLDFHNSVLRRAVALCLSLIGLSFLTSVVLFPVFGELHGENTVSGSLSKNLYYLLIAITFYFNLQLFRTLSAETIGRILDGLCIFCIVLGIIQIGVMFGLSFLSVIYDKLDVFGILNDSSYITRINRIPMTGSEPAAMTQVVCILLLPYAMSRYLHAENKARYLFYIIGLTICGFFSLSSTVFVGLTADYIMFLFLQANKRNIVYVFIALLSAALLLVLAVELGFLENTYVGQQIHYLLFEKTTDVDNLSTGYRYTTVVNDFYCFTRFPLSGVGNGNQGFLYNETMESNWVSEAMRTNYQTQWAMSGRMGLLSGGAFLPSFISGYGLIGLLLLIRFIAYLRSIMRAYRQRLNYYYEFYFIGGLAFLAAGTASVSIEGNLLALFVLSLPLVAGDYREEDSHASLRNNRHYPNHGSV